ncbi:MAG: cystathionine gamma-synthase [Pseudobdellovibrionaceae bacterium]
MHDKLTTKKIETISVRSGIGTDTAFGAVVPPLHFSTNYTFDGFGGKRKYDYSRSGNPTRDILAEAVAELEQGYGAVVTSSGMAALSLITYLVPKGGKVIAPYDCYGGTYRLLNAVAAKGSWQVQWVDFSDLKALDQTLTEGVDLVLVETPSNPLLRVVDLEAIGVLCKKYKSIYAVDNTFLSPALQQPILWGADLVVHSTTKYLNGHSDVVGGAVVSASKELHDQLAWWANCLGCIGSPFDSYMTLRGIRTLVPRMRSHLENAAAAVDLLTGHPAVKKVYYPGLPENPGHLIAKKQQKGFGAIVSFELKGDLQQVKNFLNELKSFSLAESLGGVESLVAHPASMTHAAMAEEARLKAGITNSFIRLSVGIEAKEDLILDLQQALDRA